MAGETELMDYDEERVRYEEEWQLDDEVQTILNYQRKRESSACSEKLKGRAKLEPHWPLYRCREHVPTRRLMMQ